MGQTTTALMVGIKTTGEFNAATQNEDGDDLWRDRPGVAPDFDGRYTVLGYPYAIERGAQDGCDDMLSAHSLADLETAHAEAKTAALAKWTEFANWLAARGVETPPPEVMIVQIEVA